MKYEIHLKSGTVVRFEDNDASSRLPSDFAGFDTASGPNAIRSYNGLNNSRLVVDLRQVDAINASRN